MDQYSDWELVRRARQGETAAFEALVRRYERPVIHFCLRMVQSREDAEDIAQESFVRVYRSLGRLRPKAQFATFLFTVVRNYTLNYLRNGRKHTGPGRQPLEDDTARAAAHEGPLQQAQAGEAAALLDQALERLTPEHREVLVLRELQGMDYATIAKVAGCRIGTVKSRLARAREQLRDKLVELGGGAI